jgi:hypothetical protein
LEGLTTIVRRKMRQIVAVVGWLLTASILITASGEFRAVLIGTEAHLLE